MHPNRVDSGERGDTTGREHDGSGGEGRSTGRSRRDVLKYGGGLAVAAATAGCSGILGGGDDSPSGPAGTAEAFYKAVLDGDAEEANSYVHSESPEGEVSQQQVAMFEGQEASVADVEVLEQSDGRATVAVTLEIAGETQEAETELRTEDGEWKMWN